MRRTRTVASSGRSRKTNAKGVGGKLRTIVLRCCRLMAPCIPRRSPSILHLRATPPRHTILLMEGRLMEVRRVAVVGETIINYMGR